MPVTACNAQQFRRPARACGGHPRLSCRFSASKTWRAGTSPRRTSELKGFPEIVQCDRALHQTNTRLFRNVAGRFRLIRIKTAYNSGGSRACSTASRTSNGLSTAFPATSRMTSPAGPALCRWPSDPPRSPPPPRTPASSFGAGANQASKTRLFAAALSSISFFRYRLVSIFAIVNTTVLSDPCRRPQVSRFGRSVRRSSWQVARVLTGSR
jgi:hypothetical protein